MTVSSARTGTMLFRYYFFLSEPETLRCGVEVIGLKANFFCKVEYRGSIQPTVKWIFEGNGEPVDRTPTYTYMYGRYESRLTVSAGDRSEWPSRCQIAFSRQSCNQSRAAYMRTIHCQSSDNSKCAFFSWAPVGFFSKEGKW